VKEKSSDVVSGGPEVDPVLADLGRRLLRARLRYGERMDPPISVSQMAVARAIGVTGVTVGAWEAGKNDPGLPMLYRLAELYGVMLVWLLTGQGEMYEEKENGGAKPSRPPAQPSDPATTPMLADNRAALRRRRKKNGSG
jgi:transcriptional regulator with XRE-family HTH domain